MKKSFFILLTGVLAAVLAAAEVITFEALDAMPVYKCGEKAEFQLSVTENGTAVKQGKYTIVFSMDSNRKLGRQTVDLAKGNPAKVSFTMRDPGFLLAQLFNEKGRPVLMKNAKGKTVPVLAGAGFDPEKIRMGYGMPEDFMKFWEDGRKMIAANPVKLEKVEKYSKKNYTTWYVTVDSLNNETLTGYLTIPAGKGPFPAYITVPGAGPGVSGPAHLAHKNIITLAMNVHKFPTADNAAEQKARYTAATKGRPPYATWGAGNRDTYFFRSVYVGIDRVINYIAAMPEWDKKHMVIDGSSQGGGAALLLAGYNRNITALAANVPSLCDHGGFLLGRSSGGPRLSKTKDPAAYTPYFDAGNFAGYIRVPALVSCGFLDRTCSPSSIYAVYNQLRGEKRMICLPREGHTVSKKFAKARDKFILEQLGF